MYTATDEIMLHSQRAFDVCREQVYDYEDCRQLPYNGTPNPKLCEPETYDLIRCFEKVEQVEPICLQAMNNWRECNFKYGGNTSICQREEIEFNKCQENPVWYKEEMWPRKRGYMPNYNSTKRPPRF